MWLSITKFEMVLKKFTRAVVTAVLCARKYDWSVTCCLEMSSRIQVAAAEQGGSSEEHAGAAYGFVVQVVTTEEEQAAHEPAMTKKHAACEAEVSRRQREYQAALAQYELD